MKKRIFSDSMLAAMGIIAWIIFFGLVILYTGLWKDGAIPEEDSLATMIALLVTCLIPWGGSCIYCAPQWFSSVELDSEGMRLNSVIKRSPKIPYKDIWYFNIGYYTHIVSDRYFLVMGRRGLSIDQLSRINLVRNDETLVKIRLNKKNIRYLFKVLPEPQQDRLQQLIGIDNKEVFDINQCLERQRKAKKRKERQKKKRK